MSRGSEASHASHATHTSHATRRSAGRHRWVLLRNLGHHGLGGDQESCHRSSILQGRANHLGRIHDPRLDEILVDLLLGIEAEVLVLVLEDLSGDDGAIVPGVLRNLAGWRFNRATHDVDTDLLVGLFQLDLLQSPGRNEKGRTAAGDDTFLDCRTGRVESVFHQFLALLDLDLRGTTDLDDGNTAGEFGQTLLQFLAIILGAGFLGLLADLVATALDVRLPAGAADDHRVLLGEFDAFGRAQHVEGDVLELDADNPR